MNVGVAHSEPNPNSTYFNSKGMWVTYVLVVAFIHYVFLSLPFLTVAMSWTLTNVIHNVVSMHDRRRIACLTSYVLIFYLFFLCVCKYCVLLSLAAENTEFSILFICVHYFSYAFDLVSVRFATQIVLMWLQLRYCYFIKKKVDVHRAARGKGNSV